MNKIKVQADLVCSRKIAEATKELKEKEEYFMKANAVENFRNESVRDELVARERRKRSDRLKTLSYAFVLGIIVTCISFSILAKVSPSAFIDLSVFLIHQGKV